MKKTLLLLKAPLFLAAVFFLLTSSCSKDDEMMTPSIEWQVEYSISAIGDVTIEEITYIDEFQVEQTVAGERNFRLRFNAESGFIGGFQVKATASGGGAIAKIDAIALDGSLETITVTDDEGQAGTTPKSFTLSVVLLLP